MRFDFRPGASSLFNVPGPVYIPLVMAEPALRPSGKRHYRDWYNYETRHTTPIEAFWMTVFTVALCIGLPLAFAAVFRYGLPLLGSLF